MFRIFCLFLLAIGACLAGCPVPTPPIVPPPDASDAASSDAAPAPPSLEAAPPSLEAAPAPLADSAAPPSVCVQACAAMVAAGCVQLPSCASVLAKVDAARLRIDPSVTSGDNHLTCAALVTVKTAADVQSHGWSCGPAVGR